ncbi:MAG TPA: glycosyltransferase [Bradyrhizobium sp.]|nr:glycosyltransferase [Bradyrhizobium sp.]
MDALSLSVVIPYFQREHGILRRSVLSALKQEGFGGFDIIIVDDGSPVPAIEEVADLVHAHPNRIAVIRQQNRRAGAARNAALDRVPASRRYVALLDSDDEWEPYHLATAVEVLARGYDCYFSNLYNLGEQLSKFEKEEQTGFSGRLRSDEICPLEGLPDCWEFRGDMFDRVLFSGNLIMPSTFVYDFSKFPNVRFREDFWRFGEDIIFLADMAARQARFGFSSRPAVRRGHGVNMFDKAGWGTPGFPARLCDEMAIYKHAARSWHLTKAQSHYCREKFARIRGDFVSTCGAQLSRLDFSQLSQLLRFARLDPMFPILLPLLLARSIGKKLA